MRDFIIGSLKCEQQQSTEIGIFLSLEGSACASQTTNCVNIENHMEDALTAAADLKEEEDIITGLTLLLNLTSEPSVLSLP